jgi:outer membrane receptor protein involved in Fe transport
VRGIFSQSLGGVSLDESFRLEPTQLAGFPQAWRTVISESVVGSVSAPEFETIGVALDLKPSRTTFLGFQAERITSDVQRTVGVFRTVDNAFPVFPSSTPEVLDYEEFAFVASLHQLVGNEWAFGAQYRFTDAELQSRFPERPAFDTDERSKLHRVSGYALYSHPSGLFTRFDAAWYGQSNEGYSPAQPGDDFVQLDFTAGYRLPRRRAELAVGILNITDTDYRLNPLTIYSELPRERVFFARLTFQF